MFEPFAASPEARTILFIALDVALKATVLLSLALAAHAILGRRRALARSALLNACLAGLLLLPAASMAFPRLRLAVLPGGAEAPLPSPEIRADAPTHIDPILGMESPPAASIIGPAAAVDWATLPTAMPESPTIPSGPSLDRAAPVPQPRFGIAEVAIGSYLAVAGLLVLKLACALAAIGRFRKGCTPIAEGPWVDRLDSWRRRVGVRREVVLLASARATVPAVVGWLRPAILLPRRVFEEADQSTIDAILLHELGHVRRGDYAWNLIRRTVQAAYWPHPLAWPLGKVIGAVREQACDDLCIDGLGGSAAYRATLLSVAGGLVRHRDPALGLAMARGTNLGHRLAWIDRSRGASRCLLRLPARLGVGATVVALAGMIGAVELARASQVAAQDEPARAPAPPPIPAVEESQREAMEVTVLSEETGKPIEGAKLEYSFDFAFHEQRTDREGRARIGLSPWKLKDSVNIDVWSDGYVQQRFSFNQSDPKSTKVPASLTVRLSPGEETLGGKVTDEAGRPIAGVKVEVWGYLGEKKDEHELAYMVDAETDALGNWRGRNFRKMTFANLYLSHPDYLSDGKHGHPHGRPNPRPGTRPSPDEKPMAGLRDFSDVQVMKKGAEVAGKVVDAAGKPVAGAEVGWIEEELRMSTFHFDLPTTKTDAEGRFRFPQVRPGRIAIQAKASGHAPALELTDLDAARGAVPLALTLGPPHSLSCRVVDSAQQPLAGTIIHVQSWRGYRSLGVFFKTDPEGRFRWDEAPGEPVQLLASRIGYNGVQGITARPGDREVVIALKRSLILSGRILDAETGKPIRDCEIDLGSPGSKPGEITWEPHRVMVDPGSYFTGLDAEGPAEYRLRFRAEGYAPLESRAFRADEQRAEYDAKLTKQAAPAGRAIAGVVLKPDGTPLEGAEVATAYPRGETNSRSATIEDGKLRTSYDTQATKTDAQGRFRLSREPDPQGRTFALVVVHPDFAAEVDGAGFEADPRITARPWGRIEGAARIGSKPAVGAKVMASGDRGSLPSTPQLYSHASAQTDAEGRFTIEQILPGETRVSASLGEGAVRVPWANGDLVDVDPGKTAHAELGGKGRPVIAKIAHPQGFDPKADFVRHSRFMLTSDPLLPSEIRKAGKVSAGRGEKADPAVPPRRNQVFIIDARLQPDETIRVDDILPGSYSLRLDYCDKEPYILRDTPDRIAHATKQFTVPEIPGGRSDEPLDLGTLSPKPRQPLKVGGPAPPFDIVGLDGGRIRLEDFRGKYLLLAFWRADFPPSHAELAELGRIRNRIGKGDRLEFLGLSLDAAPEAPRKALAGMAIAWPQGFAGAATAGGVADSYGIDRVTTLYLIGPDGNLAFGAFGPPAAESILADKVK